MEKIRDNNYNSVCPNCGNLDFRRIVLISPNKLECKVCYEKFPLISFPDDLKCPSCKSNKFVTTLGAPKGWAKCEKCKVEWKIGQNIKNKEVINMLCSKCGNTDEDTMVCDNYGWITCKRCKSTWEIKYDDSKSNKQTQVELFNKEKENKPIQFKTDKEVELIERQLDRLFKVLATPSSSEEDTLRVFTQRIFIFFTEHCGLSKRKGRKDFFKYYFSNPYYLTVLINQFCLDRGEHAEGIVDWTKALTSMENILVVKVGNILAKYVDDVYENLKSWCKYFDISIAKKLCKAHGVILDFNKNTISILGESKGLK